VLADCLGQHGVGGPREDFESLVVHAVPTEVTAFLMTATTKIAT
jgi:hypothetical protein